MDPNWSWKIDNYTDILTTIARIISNLSSVSGIDYKDNVSNNGAPYMG